jgi:superfamily II DNA or RNA helicase
MKSHTIELAELQKSLEEECLTLASSRRERKMLVANLNGGLKVIVNGKVVWEGVHPYYAVEAYNNVTEKHIDR